MALIELEVLTGEKVMINPFRVVKMTQENVQKDKSPEAQPEFVTTITLAGGSKETVKGKQYEIARALDQGLRR